MDPYWDPPIRCTGRTYPNGPLGALFGATTRPFPNWWKVANPVEQLCWPPLDTELPIRWNGHSPATGVIVSSNWVWAGEVCQGASPTINIFVETQGTLGHKIRCRIQKFSTFAVVGEWSKVYATGVDIMATAVVLDLQFFSGAWQPGGPPATLPLGIWRYSQMPAGRCIQSGP